MSKIIQQRMTAMIEGEFVVFLIGMRINTWWKLHKWVPIMFAMRRMLKELHANSESGLLSEQTWLGRTTLTVQYWRSFEQLEAYARDKNQAHFPEWVRFNQLVSHGGDVGIWHETYLCQSENCEAIYNNMPRFGLAKAGDYLPITPKLLTAKQRLNKI
ncbi:DUF4188 domain-containing protein [Plesiomonas sp.]|uniref:DUF4188 domain-containing protein n=1 Tax=Plesiomonas sp. TaxID=2486279 RepID=UPI003F3BF47B